MFVKSSYLQIFTGNSDTSSIKENSIDAIVARYVRVVVITWEMHASMRMEIIGYRCN